MLLLPDVLPSGAQDLAVVSAAEGVGTRMGNVIEYVCVGTERLCVNLVLAGH